MSEEPMDDTEGQTEDERLMLERATSDRATAILARTVLQPEEVAAENAQLRSAVKGSHALMHALVRTHVGVGKTVRFERTDWESPDPREELDVKVMPDRAVELTIRTPNRAQRRAKG